MTSRVWLSIMNLIWLSAPVFTRRKRYLVPASKFNSKREPVSLYTFVPLMRPLAAVGGPVIEACSARLSAVSWCSTFVSVGETQSLKMGLVHDTSRGSRGYPDRRRSWQLQGHLSVYHQTLRPMPERRSANGTRRTHIESRATCT